MLHCASMAFVCSPLAFVATAMVEASGVGVAQTKGEVCGPAITGPPMGGLVITIRAAWLFDVLATSTFSPFASPLTRPRMRPPARTAKPPATPRPVSWTRSAARRAPPQAPRRVAAIQLDAQRVREFRLRKHDLDQGIAAADEIGAIRQRADLDLRPLLAVVVIGARALGRPARIRRRGRR